MAAREKVPFVMWTANDSKQAGRYWVAVFANEGADKLAHYIDQLRDQYRTMKSDGRYAAADLEDVAAVGKHAVKVYARHFGALP